MNCSEVKSQLPCLFSQAQAGIEDPEICKHLAHCASCRQEWHELEQLGKLLAANPAPRVAVDLRSLYRRAALQEARAGRRWRWLGLAASLFLLLGGACALLTRLELRWTDHELALHWGARPEQVISATEPSQPAGPTAAPTDKREDQIELLSATIRAMLQELQTVDMRQRRDRADMDTRVSGLQEQSLRRWLALQKDMEALYVLTQKGE